MKQLHAIAKEIRLDILRITTEAGSGHPGGSLSATDIMTALYFYKLRHDPKKPNWPDRDRFVLSKGHAAPALYSVLAHSGYFPRKELMNLRKMGSMLQGHPEMARCPGVEASTGPLGQGLSFANGIALAGKTDRKKYKVYVMLGDGEIQEGQVWEAAMTSSHYKLDNLTGILDNNNLQIDGFNEEVMNIKPIREKWEAFGWHTMEIDGHDFNQIKEALDKADSIKGKPTMIICHTIKGKGICCMENKAEWHGKACTPEELKGCLKDLDQGINDDG
ncbi:transketolase [Candidatus Woesearchaeota archaeon]|nr:transketolase [Candidatus Woesearchaeota archaeon]